MKTFYLRPIILLVIFFLPFQEIKASHIMGGSITWECTGTNQYRFTLTIYRDCAGAPQNSTFVTITNTAGSNIVCTKIATNYYNPECNAPACAGASPLYAGAVEEHIYRSAPITLTGVPPASGWVFTWTTCCRPSGVTNLIGSAGLSYTLRSVMYPITNPGSTQANNADPCFNSSPKFYEKPLFAYCANTNQSYMAGGTDADGDSMHVDYAPAMDGSVTAPVNYSAGYTYSQPLPASSNQYLNTQNGAYSFNSNTQGKFALSTKIEEWRHGQLIGEVYRDMIVIVKPCTPPPGLCGGIANAAPTIALQAANGYPTLTPIYDNNNNLIRYEASVTPGTNVKFDMIGADANLNPSCTPQVISFDGQGTQLSAGPAFNSLTNCPVGVNCATISSNNAGGVFSNSISNWVQFNWAPQCQTWGANEAKKAFDFYFSFNDDGCPLPEETSVFVRINVVNPTMNLISALSKTLCPNGTVTLNGAQNMASYSWSNGGSGQSISVNQPGSYTLTAIDSIGCTYVAQTTVDTLNLYTTVPDICLVTLDPATGFNNIVWERPNKNGVAAYVIFRGLSSSSFVPIDTVDANSMSVYVDSNSNQNNAQYNYYLALLDSCGGLNGSAVFTHSAPFLMAGFLSGTKVSLNWSHYVGRTPNYYIIYRSDSTNALYQKLDSVAYPATNYIDSILPASGSFSYRVGAVMDSSCLPTAKTDLNQAISNTALFQVFGNEELDLGTGFQVYPNPSSGVFVFNTQLSGSFEVYSHTGQLVKTGFVQSNEVSLVGYPNGVYLLRVTLKNGQTIVHRLVKN